MLYRGPYRDNSSDTFIKRITLDLGRQSPRKLVIIYSKRGVKKRDNCVLARICALPFPHRKEKMHW